MSSNSARICHLSISAEDIYSNEALEYKLSEASYVEGSDGGFTSAALSLKKLMASLPSSNKEAWLQYLWGNTKQVAGGGLAAGGLLVGSVIVVVGADTMATPGAAGGILMIGAGKTVIVSTAYGGYYSIKSGSLSKEYSKIKSDSPELIELLKSRKSREIASDKIIALRAILEDNRLLSTPLVKCPSPVEMEKSLSQKENL